MIVQQGLAAREGDLAACLGDPTLRRAPGPIRGTQGQGRWTELGLGLGLSGLSAAPDCQILQHWLYHPRTWLC